MMRLLAAVAVLFVAMFGLFAGSAAADEPPSTVGISVDVAADNGVIHVVDDVLIGIHLG